MWPTIYAIKVLLSNSNINIEQPREEVEGVRVRGLSVLSLAGRASWPRQATKQRRMVSTTSRRNRPSPPTTSRDHLGRRHPIG